MKHDTPTHLLWDLGNTLLTVDTISFARNMGLIDMLLYQLVDRSSPTELLDKALEFLALLSDENSRSCSAKAQGKILPPVVCAWLSGQVALADAEAFLYGQHFEQHTPDEFFI